MATVIQTWLLDGGRLRALREEADIHYEDFAKRIGRHPRHYLKMELAGQQTTGQVLHRIRRTLSSTLGRDVAFAEFCVRTAVEARAKRVGTGPADQAGAA